MSIRRVQCPGCGAAVNVPAAMASAKCPKCQQVFNPMNPSSGRTSKTANASSQSNKNEATAKQVARIGALIGGGGLIAAIVGVVVVAMNRPSPPPKTENPAASSVETETPPEPYVEIRKPEEERRRMYAAYRKQARTTIEKPLAIPKGAVRNSVENMLHTVDEGGIQRLAALHDVTVDEFREVIKEGNAKGW